MKELLDVYYAYGNKSGKIIERGTLLEPGEYFFAVHIYLYNSKGEFLLTKRSEKLKNYPGLWDMTSGCIVSGEDSLQAAQREVYEELGVELPEEQLEYMGRFRRKWNLVDIWFARCDFEPEDYSFQDGEVAAVKLLSAEEMIEAVRQLPNREEEYKQLITEFIEEKAGVLVI